MKSVFQQWYKDFSIYLLYTPPSADKHAAIVVSIRKTHFYVFLHIECITVVNPFWETRGRIYKRQKPEPSVYQKFRSTGLHELFVLQTSLQ